MTAYVPPGWPAGVHPPGSPEFEPSAVVWLLSVVPADFQVHGVLKRHPIALASLARHYLSACVDGARNGYRTARTELGPHLPPAAVEAVLAAYRSEGSRLAAAAKGAELVERALHGEVFVRQMAGGRVSASRSERVGQAAALPLSASRSERVGQAAAPPLKRSAPGRPGASRSPG